MKRRMFLKAIGAAVAAPVAPNVAIGVPIAASPTEYLTVAKLIARSHNRCSRPMLMRLLKLDASMAAQVEGMLLEKGIITFPNAAGLSKAVNPIIANPFPKVAQKMARPKECLRDVVKELSDLAKEDDAPISEPEIAPTSETATENH